jgi:UDP-N-acetylmuramoylalanine--D-glutamate ligase
MNTPVRVAVLGLARSGSAAATLALARGASVYASDGADTPELQETAARLRQLGADVQLGGHDETRLAGCDVVVVSPGIPPTAPVLSSPALRAVERISEIEFAFRHLASPVIAITGTNGKTTTTALIAHLLRSAGFDAPAAGNIGAPLSEIALRETPPDWVVVEASSFQLADIRTFAPRIGVVTNLSPDHLDRYASVEAYYADKARLFQNATQRSLWVLNGDDDAVLGLAADAPGWRRLFVVERPLPVDAFGGYVDENGRLLLHLESGDAELLPSSELPLLGPHNRANALAAALTAHAGGADLESVRRGLRTFEAPAHRLQPVIERDGVLWINDSKATNIASARVALRSVERPTILLLGGRHKGEPYTGLLPDLSAHVKLVVAYGEAAPIIERELSPHVDVERVDGPFAAVIARAAQRALPGDAVLLAPACSSFDMFRDFEERGTRFTELATRGAQVANGA